MVVKIGEPTSGGIRMQVVDHLTVDDVAGALDAESKYRRAWLPAEPYWDALLIDAERTGSAILTELRRGMRVPLATVVNARKYGHGVRPIAVMSPATRIAYRALAAHALGGDYEPPDRSAEAYAEFVLKPVREGFDGGGFRRISSSKFKYVVTSDLAAFFDYVDHEVLRTRLDVRQADMRSTDGLIDLLGETSGRSYGLPQQSAVSDWLADLIGGQIENELLRAGFEAWRYSDDFRVGCANYSEALRAMEVLSDAARDVGLIVNDSKTLTPSMLTYIVENSDVEVDDVSAEIDPDDVEAAVTSDYLADTDAQAIGDAESVFDRLIVRDAEQEAEPLEDDDAIDLKRMSANDHRAVRRAMNTLAKHQSTAAIPKLKALLAFQPAMTHRVVGYAQSVADAESGALRAIFSEVAQKYVLNGWQRAWVAHAFRTCQFDLAPGGVDEAWLENVFLRHRTGLDGAEAALALAEQGRVELDVLDHALREAPDDLKPWFLRAMRALPMSPQLQSRLSAYANAAPLWDAMVSH
jgi:hypothetical protein